MTEHRRATPDNGARGTTAHAPESTAASGISERFRDQAAARPVGDVPELLPTRLAEVTCQVTGSAGAGLSLMSQSFRVPLGASGPGAAVLERLQFTAAQGPCWDAIRADLPLAADLEQIDATWPQFAEEMRRATPFASVVSVPLRLARETGGALDLYFTDPAGSDTFDLDDATVVAAHIADRLNRADTSTRPPDLHGVRGPAWARGPAARGRLAVWIAVGMVMSETDGQPVDALATLRAAAWSATRSLDDVASDLVRGHVTVADLLAG